MAYQDDVRRARRQRRLGPNAKCRTCGESDPAALLPADTCYACRQAQMGRSGLEKHHPAGQANDPMTVAIPANDHRVLSDFQQQWPEATLRNPDGSPLLRAAASIRGLLDVLRLIMERTVGWIPPFLEALDSWLRDQLGGRWWDGLQWQR